MSKTKNKSKLTLGPLLHHWDEDKRRDFYFKMADEADVDVVYLGEVVCSKRESALQKHLPAIVQRLEQAGKEVVFSTLALVTTPKESDRIKQLVDSGVMVEANDVAVLNLLEGRPFVVGPTINVLNEGTRDFVASLGARRIVMASEVATASIAILAASQAEANNPPEIEVQVFGRASLSVSMRCYHARAFGRDKDHCQLACAAHLDGLPVHTIDARPVFTVNGTQVLSHGCILAIRELQRLARKGVTHFRLMPRDMDMIQIVRLYRQVLNGTESPEVALIRLREMMPDLPPINGFLHAREGMAWVE